MNKLEQAARQALEALEHAFYNEHTEAECSETITAILEALAEQADQEPVAWGWATADGEIVDCICPDQHDITEGYYTIPLYAAPVRTKDLSESDVAKAIEPFRNEFVASGRTTMNIARAVIAADREKNK